MVIATDFQHRPSLEAGTEDAPVPVIESRFAHTIAHDLRSPLTAIQMCADALSMSEDAGLRRKYAVLISEQAKAIAWSLENLVALGDSQLWQQCPRQRVDLATVLVDCLEELREQSASRGVTVLQHLDAQDLRVVGVEAALRQALRGCIQVLMSISPQGAQLLIRGVRHLDSESGRHLVRIAIATRPDCALRAQRVDALDLPWRRVTLMAAQSILREHGGSASETRSPDVLGLTIELPVGPLTAT